MAGVQGIGSACVQVALTYRLGLGIEFRGSGLGI